MTTVSEIFMLGDLVRTVELFLPPSAMTEQVLCPLTEWFDPLPNKTLRVRWDSKVPHALDVASYVFARRPDVPSVMLTAVPDDCPSDLRKKFIDEHPRLDSNRVERCLAKIPLHDFRYSLLTLSARNYLTVQQRYSDYEAGKQRLSCTRLDRCHEYRIGAPFDERCRWPYDFRTSYTMTDAVVSRVRNLHRRFCRTDDGKSEKQFGYLAIELTYGYERDSSMADRTVISHCNTFDLANIPIVQEYNHFASVDANAAVATTTTTTEDDRRDPTVTSRDQARRIAYHSFLSRYGDPLLIVFLTEVVHMPVILPRRAIRPMNATSSTNTSQSTDLMRPENRMWRRYAMHSLDAPRPTLPAYVTMVTDEAFADMSAHDWFDTDRPVVAVAEDANHRDTTKTIPIARPLRDIAMLTLYEHAQYDDVYGLLLPGSQRMMLPSVLAGQYIFKEAYGSTRANDTSIESLMLDMFIEGLVYSNVRASWVKRHRALARRQRKRLTRARLDRLER